MRRVPLALLLGAVTLATLGAASCGADESPIALAAASRGTVAEIVDAPATVTAKAAATLTAPADGTLAELRVEPGDTVRRGQVLAVISSPAARKRLKDARAALDAAKAAGGGFGGGSSGLTRVQAATDRAAADAFDAARSAARQVADPSVRAALLAQVRAAEKHYDAAADAAADAVGDVRRGVAGLSSAMSALSSAQRLQARQAYDLARSTVDALTLRAPVPGVVQLGGPAAAGAGQPDLTALLEQAGGSAALPTEVVPPASGPAAGVDGSVPVGGRVTAGTPVLTVVDVSSLGLVAEVDETDVLLVEAGLPATVELDAATGATYDGAVRAVDVLPTSSTRGGVAYRVRLSLTGGTYADGAVAPTPRPGMSAVVRLRVREATGAVTVPAAAVFSAEGQDSVWLVRDGRAERVPVRLGVQGADLVQIVSGVDAGQRIVVRGTDQVRVGQELR